MTNDFRAAWWRNVVFYILSIEVNFLSPNSHGRSGARGVEADHSEPCAFGLPSFYQELMTVVLDVAKSLRCLAAGSSCFIVAVVLQGCAPEGTGSIKIEDPSG